MDWYKHVGQAGWGWVSKSNTWRWAAVLLAATSVGCFASLKWEQENQRCDPDLAAGQNCLSGFSCLGQFCISDNSVPKGNSCVNSQQCTAGLICPGSSASPEGREFTCRDACSNDDHYGLPSSCPSSEWCRPFTPSGGGEVFGACVASECSVDAECTTAGQTCVMLASGVGACLSACNSITFPGTPAAYADDCGGTNRVCQPVGTGQGSSGEKRVCFVAATEGGVNGDSCSPFTNPCASGFSCREGICRRYCLNNVLLCPDGEGGCNEVEPGANGYGFCFLPPGSN